MIKRLDRITTYALLLIIVLYTLEALRFPGNAKIVPAIFGGVAFIVVMIQLLSSRVKAFRTLSSELEIEEEKDLALFHVPVARKRFVRISASLLAIPLLIAVFGLALTLPLYVAVMLLIERQRLYVVVLCTALIAATSYGLLVQLLGWPWNDGFLWSFLR